MKISVGAANRAACHQAHPKPEWAPMKVTITRGTAPRGPRAAQTNHTRKAGKKDHPHQTCKPSVKAATWRMAINQYPMNMAIPAALPPISFIQAPIERARILESYFGSSNPKAISCSAARRRKASGRDIFGAPIKAPSSAIQRSMAAASAGGTRQLIAIASTLGRPRDFLALDIDASIF